MKIVWLILLLVLVGGLGFFIWWFFFIPVPSVLIQKGIALVNTGNNELSTGASTLNPDLVVQGTKDIATGYGLQTSQPQSRFKNLMIELFG